MPIVLLLDHFPLFGQGSRFLLPLRSLLDLAGRVHADLVQGPTTYSYGYLQVFCTGQSGHAIRIMGTLTTTTSASSGSPIGQ